MCDTNAALFIRYAPRVCGALLRLNVGFFAHDHGGGRGDVAGARAVRVLVAVVVVV